MNRKFNLKKILIITVTDILVFAVSLLTFAYFDHVRPMDVDTNQGENTLTTSSPDLDNSEGNFFFSDSSTQSTDTNTSEGNVSTNDQSSEESSEENVEDKTPQNSIFTNGEVIQTENSYKSKYLNITVKEIEFGGKLYMVQDIYIRSIDCIAVGFATENNPFSGQYKTIKEITDSYKAKGHNIIASINGDYCGLSKKGAVIRNGTLYGSGVPDYDVCIIYNDGRMETKAKKDFDAQTELANGALHVWDFGPILLNADGSAIEDFSNRKDISKTNPRTAIGYYEPGHYCFIVAGGRDQPQSYGVKLSELAAFTESLGCRSAYNLDGGRSSIMIFGDEIVNEEYQDVMRKNSDIIFIQDFS